MNSKIGFTMPGESGYEKLTLGLAEKWGADVIRDSDGTTLSDEIIQAGYGIYSTVCMIRDHNEWARKHPDKLQQTFLISKPVTALSDLAVIPLLDGYYTEQFRVNESSESRKYWQVFDRTVNEEVPAENWKYDGEEKTVTVKNTVPFHQYTVNFMAYRIWEEISMYNHVTNNWDKEHLMPVDPRSEEAQAYLYQWLDQWCREHPDTTVVRFTSMFYNFVWIWGSSEKNRNLYTDWASYDFTVSPQALDDFERECGYALTSEDFINQGRLHVTHMPPTKKLLDYIGFTNRFVVEFGKKLVDLVKSYGKKAYVFYDDSWVGTEPYSSLFPEFGFDGMIKCVFSGYEVRLCANVKTEVHEIRLHPYLFPVGLGGKPTFSKGGDPAEDARRYWVAVRRALLRQPVERIGLGGYLHLVQDYPDFVDCIAEISEEFRKIVLLHEEGDVYTCPVRVAVLHSWGALRSWSLSGHFHETYMHDLIHVNEALSGFPVQVSFLGFEDIKNGALDSVDVLINAGAAGTAWSGGDRWKDDEVVEKISRFVYDGGTFLGIHEPSAVPGYMNYFRMAEVLGVDKDTGARTCHGRWPVEEKREYENACIPKEEGVFLLHDKVEVLRAEKSEIREENVPTLTVNRYGKGRGIYMSHFRKGTENNRMLLELLLSGIHERTVSLPDNPAVECAYFPESRMLVAVNNSDQPQETRIGVEGRETSVVIAPYGSQAVSV